MLRIQLWFVVCAVALSLSPALLAQVQPRDVDGLALWLSADAGVETKGDAVRRWRDQSGRKNDVQATKHHGQPRLQASVAGLKGRPALVFDGKGGSNFENAQALLGQVKAPFDGNQVTIFAVCRWEQRPASSLITLGPNANTKVGRGGVGLRRGRASKSWFTVHNGGDGNVERLQTKEPPLDDRYHVLCVVFDKRKSSIRMFVDGRDAGAELRDGSTIPLDPIRYIQLGGHGILDAPGNAGSEWFFGGELAEIVVYQRALSSGDSRVLEENELGAVGWYLQTKYGFSGMYREPIVPKDSDGDGIPDHVEASIAFLDPQVKEDASRDRDGDGLSNRVEFELGTALEDRDSDDDGLSDGAEHKSLRTNPLLADTDQDGLGDLEEFIEYRTDPTARDTDGDSFPDGFEVLDGTNPKDAGSQPEAKFHVAEEEVLFGSVSVALDGTVLLFEEQREKGQVEVKRSVDAGLTWSDPIVVGKRVKIDGDMSDDGRYRGPHIGWSELGSSIVDESTGDILVFASSLKTAQVIYRSRDHGKTWNEERVVIRPDKNGWLPATLASSDPGVTLRYGEKKGRLLIPTRVFVGYLNKGKGRKYFDRHYSNAIYSDDGGRTWNSSAPFPLGGTGESGTNCTSTTCGCRSSTRSCTWCTY
ncbi:MAG: LamG-like jellyroll fold domain-containing protein [Planctomycetota bacterium]